MFDSISEIFNKYNFFAQFFNLVIGAIIGGLLGVKYAIGAKRPRLLIEGSGGGGNDLKQSWSLTISNKPSFFGQLVDGEPARDLRAHLQLKEKKSEVYCLFWGSNKEKHTTINVCDFETLDLFHWSHEHEGYYIVDKNGDRIARFSSGTKKFIVTLSDRLYRKYKFLIIVKFDDSNLQSRPRMNIFAPVPFHSRLDTFKSGMRQIFSALWPRP